ncbi:hypothetical protein [Loktanella sp. SALINAS62]|uniref:hypothetical protein n=1 Tax=Loktanella sp. SALINAS62 TaxID=2706124 RepID=UPI001B8CE4D0|nr:hypothetical protein [Loktanella sp. SALINAS62]MBS1303975.1 hypothetical protein [Loktanella sp. SALINAS62]
MSDFPRVPQTIARIGAGLVSMAALTWLFWDGVLTAPDAEPLLTFSISLFVWFSTEFKRSDEIVYRASTANDIRVAKLFLGYHAHQLRTLLWEHSFRNSLPSEYFDEFSALTTDIDRRLIKFQKPRLRNSFDDFSFKFIKFIQQLATNTTREGDEESARIYVKARRLSPGPWTAHEKAEANELDALGSECWELLNRLIEKVHTEVPEAFDDEINISWRYVRS